MIPIGSKHAVSSPVSVSNARSDSDNSNIVDQSASCERTMTEQGMTYHQDAAPSILPAKVLIMF